MIKTPLKILFMGTPEFAVAYLKSLIDSDFFEVVAVITQPDKPLGRKQIITPSPVKFEALKHNLTIIQPEKLKNNPAVLFQLQKIEFDLIVVVAYGQIIPSDILALAKLGNINVHPSLLPQYRGASPIQNAILNNETTTGITIMLMDEKMDHGPILAQKKFILDGTETSESLHQKMSDKLSTDFLIETIQKFVDKKITAAIQNDDNATYCKLITKDEAKINWSDSAKNISAKIRAFYPWPVAWTTLNHKKIKIFPPIKITDGAGEPGKILSKNNKLLVATPDKLLEIFELQIEGKNKIKAKDFILGHKNIAHQSLE